MEAAGFLSRSLSGPLPYVRRHITVNKNVLSASLNKTFLPSIPSCSLASAVPTVHFSLWMYQYFLSMHIPHTHNNNVYRNHLSTLLCPWRCMIICSWRCMILCSWRCMNTLICSVKISTYLSLSLYIPI